MCEAVAGREVGGSIASDLGSVLGRDVLVLPNNNLQTKVVKKHLLT